MRIGSEVKWSWFVLVLYTKSLLISLIYSLFDKFLSLKVSPEIEHLPDSQAQQTTHAEYAKKQYTIVCRL